MRIPLALRLAVLLAATSSLSSCGTATHLLGQAGGLVNSVTSPILGSLRLSDSPLADPSPPLHDPSPTPAERPH